MKKDQLKKLIREIIEEVQQINQRSQKKQQLLKSADVLISEMNEISKREFGI